MRILGLYHLILLLRRSPETEYERAMLLHRLRSRRTRLSVGAIILLAGMGAAGTKQLNINGELECLALTVYFEARGDSARLTRGRATLPVQLVSRRSFRHTARRRRLA